MAAQRHAHAIGADDVVFTSLEGQLLEGPTSTVVWAAGGHAAHPARGDRHPGRDDDGPPVPPRGRRRLADVGHPRHRRRPARRRRGLAALRRPGRGSPCTRWTACRGATPDCRSGCGSCSPGNVDPGAPGSLVGNVSSDPFPRSRPRVRTDPHPPLRPRIVDRDAAHRRGPPPGDRRRCAAADRRRHRAGLGELALGGRLRVAPRPPRRPVVAAPGPDARHLGRRRAAGDLLLRRRAGAQAGVRRRATCASRGARPCRWPRRSGGMVVPALFFVLFNLGGPEGALRGWAIPSATDIAFALAVLAVISTHLPSALRTFLLTLAVVDDLLAIVVIAIFYTERPVARVPRAVAAAARGLRAPGAAQGPVGLAAAARSLRSRGCSCTSRGCTRPSPASCWRSPCPWCAATRPAVRTPAPVSPSTSSTASGRCRPGVAVPVFAFFSAGVAVGGISGLGASLGDSIAIGIVVGLVAGKAIGITRGHLAGLPVHPGPARREPRLARRRSGCPCSAGSASPSRCSSPSSPTGPSSERYDHAKVGILAGTAPRRRCWPPCVLRLRNRRYQRIEAEERSDVDADGIPDVWDPVDDRRPPPFAEG